MRSARPDSNMECSVSIIVGTALAVLISSIVVYLLQIPRPRGGRSFLTTRPVVTKLPISTVLTENKAVVTLGKTKDGRDMRYSGFGLRVCRRLLYSRFGKLFLLPKYAQYKHLDAMSYVQIPEPPAFAIPSPSRPPNRDYARSNQQKLEKLVDAHQHSAFNSVADYVQAFRSGKCTPSDVALKALDYVSQSNSASPPLRAIVDSNRDAVLAMAAASTERWRQKKPLSLLDGIPVAVKGEFKVEPYVLRGGSAFTPHLSNGIEEGSSVKRLKEAGAVVIGMANMQEYGTGALGSNPNKYNLHARNPYNTNHFAGGSSSGSAVSIAAGLCPIALGSDTGGSIRMPASLCGVVGLKPTHKALDDGGILPGSFSLYAHGPLGASVLDCAIALDIISDRKMVPLKSLGETKLSGLRVGVYWDHFEDASKEVVKSCKAAVDLMKTLGAEVKDIVIPELDDSKVAHLILCTTEMGNPLLADVDRHFYEMNIESLMFVALGYNVSATEYINSQRQRTRAIAIMEHIFGEVDVIVSPATGITAPAIAPQAVSKGVFDFTATGQLINFTGLANFTGVPGLVLPVGYTTSGLPIGMQLLGRWHEEHVLLQTGWALESSGAFPLKKPSTFYDLLSTV